jgi:hypothetical protein
MYKCKNCGYGGKELVFQFTDHGYCVASNKGKSDFISSAPGWVTDMAVGDAEIGEPVGCPKCHAWGGYNFETIS